MIKKKRPRTLDADKRKKNAEELEARRVVETKGGRMENPGDDKLCRGRRGLGRGGETHVQEAKEKKKEKPRRIR